MSLLDFFTGDANKKAQGALDAAYSAYSQVGVPTANQLTLPQLQQYVQAGLMTPEEAQAYMQQTNAYSTENVPQEGTQAMQEALGQLSGIADAGPMGTPVQQAQEAQTIQQMNNAVQGQRGAIEQQMEAKGTPAALVQAALQNQYVGQDATQAYQNSLNQQSAAYQAAVQALSEKGTLGGQLQGQQNTQANTVSQAQNAMQQFNAANQQQNSQFNAGQRQVANATNLKNAQDTANQNVGTANARTAYNANLPETVFNNQMQKAGGEAGVNEAQANAYTQEGQQNAGLYSSLIGAGTDLGAAYLTGGASAAVPKKAAGGVLGHENCYHDGGLCMKSGGMVPGQPQVPGDSLTNDTVHVMASPGEAVIPRTAVQQHMPEVLSLIASARQPEHHPQDVASVLQALRHLRTGAH